MSKAPQHSERAHARLSASGSSIWLNCTASPVLSEGIERRSSKYAEEGTRAHETAEAMLRGEDADDETVREALAPYLDHVRDLMARTPIHKIEHRVNLAELWDGDPPDELFGTADFAGVTPDRTLHVSDLKFGRGIPVDVRDNSQLLYYALGVYLDLRGKVEIERVRMTIVQPRAAHADGPVRTWEIPVLDLVLWAEDVLKPAIDLICEGDLGKLVVREGKWCRWCPAAATTCPLKQLSRVDEAKNEFDVIVGA